jgi:hypothetical protein
MGVGDRAISNDSKIMPALLFLLLLFHVHRAFDVHCHKKLILHAWVARGDSNNTPHKTSPATFFSISGSRSLPFPVHVLAQFPVPMAEISSLAGITARVGNGISFRKNSAE